MGGTSYARQVARRVVFGGRLALVLSMSAWVSCAVSRDRDDSGATELDVEALDVPDVPPDLTLEELDADLRRLRCDWAIRCEALAPGVRRSSCHPAARDQETEFGIAERVCPSLEYNQDAAMRCLAAAAALAADCHARAARDVSACDHVFSERPPPGSTCRRFGCGDDSVCAPPVDCESRDCPWSCRPAGRDGEPCGWYGIEFGREPSVECAEGFECVYPGFSWVGGVCRAETVPGEPCVPNEIDCTWAEQTCEDGICRARGRAEGDPCYAGCLGELDCMDRGDGERECTRGAAPGERCIGWPCDVGNRCVRGTCVEIVHPDEACGADAVCPETFHCVGGRCLASPLPGERCSDEVPCADGVCRSGACVALGPGEPCSPVWSPDGFGDCAVGTCDLGTARCVPVRADGESCSLTGEACAEGLWCDWTMPHVCRPLTEGTFCR